MIRIIVQTDDAQMAANVGGAVHTTMDTFDIEATELERFMRQKMPSLVYRNIIGAELKGDANG